MRRMFFGVVTVIGVFLGFSSALSAQLLMEFHPKPAANCCSAIYSRRLADDLQDWPGLGRYYQDDQKLMAEPVPRGRVVFLGDSITDFWPLAKYFPEKPYVNRGISGQTTPQMALRMYQDVIRLKPTAVILLAGTNDIAGNTGAVTLTMIQDNLRLIAETAANHGIKIIFCSLLPVSDYTRYKQSVERPPADILRLNAWMRNYATEIHAGYVDYYSVTVDDQGFLKKEYSKDGLHPNDAGYEVMAPVAEAAIEKILH